VLQLGNIEPVGKDMKLSRQGELFGVAGDMLANPAILVQTQFAAAIITWLIVETCIRFFLAGRIHAHVLLYTCNGSNRPTYIFGKVTADGTFSRGDRCHRPCMAT